VYKWLRRRRLGVPLAADLEAEHDLTDRGPGLGLGVGRVAWGQRRRHHEPDLDL
jgi:hypothetical protein